MKVLVADDAPIMRFGIVSILRQYCPQIETFEAGDGAQALEILRGEDLDLALLDVRMPKLSGLGVLEQNDTEVPIIMVTHSEEPAIIQAAMRGGASGYLVLGDITPEEIGGVIKTCLNGGMVMSKTAGRGLKAAASEHFDIRDEVSQREAEILDFVVQGMSNKEIAKELFLSERTVKNYLNASYKKIGVNNRNQAAIVWRDRAFSVDLACLEVGAL